MLSYVVSAMRPRQWYKNFLLFAGIVFSKRLFDTALWAEVVAGFLAFCLLSSATYLFNDIADRKLDVLHPKKRHRPVASGVLPIGWAAPLASFFALASLAVSWFIDPSFFFAAAGYLALMMLYSRLLKTIEIIDVIVIGIGFVIRAIAGCLIVGVLISPWLILCTFLLALFLAFGKRRHELAVDPRHRQTLTRYTEPLLDGFLSMTSAALIISYSLYTFLAQTTVYLMLTIPFVVFGVFRFTFLIHSNDEASAATELVFRDGPMLANLVFWAACVVFILYFSY